MMYLLLPTDTRRKIRQCEESGQSEGRTNAARWTRGGPSTRAAVQQSPPMDNLGLAWNGSTQKLSETEAGICFTTMLSWCVLSTSQSEESNLLSNKFERNSLLTKVPSNNKRVAINRPH